MNEIMVIGINNIVLPQFVVILWMSFRKEMIKHLFQMIIDIHINLVSKEKKPDLSRKTGFAVYVWCSGVFSFGTGYTLSLVKY